MAKGSGEEYLAYKTGNFCIIVKVMAYIKLQ